MRRQGRKLLRPGTGALRTKSGDWKAFECEGRGGSCCARGRAHAVGKAGTGKHSNAKAGAEVAAPGDGRTPYEKRGLESIRMRRQGRKLLRPGTGALRTKSGDWKAFECEGRGGSCW